MAIGARGLLSLLSDKTRFQNLYTCGRASRPSKDTKQKTMEGISAQRPFVEEYATQALPACARWLSSRIMLTSAAALFAAMLFAAPSPARDDGDFDGVRFRISDDRLLLVPVFINDRRYLFEIDTGSTRSALDRSFRDGLGDPIARTGATTPDGHKSVDLFSAPPAMLAGRRLSGVSQVVCMDFSAIRASSGTEIYGIVGMDFLSRRTLRIDVDAGEIVFLASVPEDSGTQVPIVLSAEGLPSVRATLNGVSDRMFIIDTGHVGIGSGLLETRLMTHLVDIGSATRVGQVLTVSYENNGTKRLQARFDDIALGRFRHSGTVFTEAAVSTLGMGYLSRYIVTFDFQERKMYLKPGARFNEPSRCNLSGAHLLRLSAKTTVESVDEGSASDRAGLKRGDIIEEIDSRATGSMSMFQIRKLFSMPGKYILRLNRDSAVVQVTLVLKEREVKAANERTQQR